MTLPPTLRQTRVAVSWTHIYPFRFFPLERIQFLAWETHQQFINSSWTKLESMSEDFFGCQELGFVCSRTTVWKESSRIWKYISYSSRFNIKPHHELGSCYKLSSLQDLTQSTSSSFSICSWDGDHLSCKALSRESSYTSFGHHSPQLVKKICSGSSGKSSLVNAAKIDWAPEWY